MDQSTLETKLEAASRLLRSHGWTVLRPDPFRRIPPQEGSTSCFPASFDAKKQEAPATPSVKQLPVPAEITTRNQLAAWRLAMIREHAGKIRSPLMAAMLGMSLSSLKQIAWRNDISLRVKDE